MPLRLLAALLTCTLLAACESDEKKAERLRSDQAVACLPVRTAEFSGAAPSSEARAKCDVATRKLNKFMAGR